VYLAVTEGSGLPHGSGLRSGFDPRHLEMEVALVCARSDDAVVRRAAAAERAGIAAARRTTLASGPPFPSARWLGGPTSALHGRPERFTRTASATTR
jgi:hypothetical protein